MKTYITADLCAHRPSGVSVSAKLQGGKLEKFELVYNQRDLTKDNALNDIPLAEAAELADCFVELVSEARGIHAKCVDLEKGA